MVLERVAEGLWTVTRPLAIAGLPLGTRMNVIRLPDGGLCVHSAVRLEPEIEAAIEALGPVRALIAPNRYHHLFLRRWREHWPDAECWAAPGLPDKRRELSFTGVLGDVPPRAWKGTLEQHVLDGAPTLGEVVFYHPATRTLLLTDVAFNIHGSRGLARLFWKLNGLDGRFGPSRFERLLIRDKAAFARSVERILEWDFDRILVAHGDPVAEGGRALFEAAFARWM